MVVAQAARNRSTAGEILGDEGPDNVLLEALLLADHVIRNAEGLSHAACVVDVVNGTATAMDRLGHAVVASKPTLVPELECEPTTG